MGSSSGLPPRRPSVGDKDKPRRLPSLDVRASYCGLLCPLWVRSGPHADPLSNLGENVPAQLKLGWCAARHPPHARLKGALDDVCFNPKALRLDSCVVIGLSAMLSDIKDSVL